MMETLFTLNLRIPAKLYSRLDRAAQKLNVPGPDLLLTFLEQGLSKSTSRDPDTSLKRLVMLKAADFSASDIAGLTGLSDAMVEIIWGEWLRVMAERPAAIVTAAALPKPPAPAPAPAPAPVPVPTPMPKVVLVVPAEQKLIAMVEASAPIAAKRPAPVPPVPQLAPLAPTPSNGANFMKRNEPAPSPQEQALILVMDETCRVIAERKAALERQEGAIAPMPRRVPGRLNGGNGRGTALELTAEDMEFVRRPVLSAFKRGQ